MINGEFVQLAIMDIGKSVAGLAVAESLDLYRKFDFGNTFVMRHASNGAISALVSEAIDAVTVGSKLFHARDVVGTLDDALFFTAVSAGGDQLGVDAIIERLARENLNLSRPTAELVRDATLLSGSRVLARYVDATPLVPNYIKNLRYPISVLTGRK